jgi:hypothetical protein
MIHWHRLFGLALTDFFSDSPYVVELEKDLSLRLRVIVLSEIPRSKPNVLWLLFSGLRE